MMSNRTIINSLVLLLFLTVNSFSDAVVTMEYKDGSNQSISSHTNSFKGSDMKMDYFEGGTTPSITRIFKGDKDVMIILDHSSKTYTVLDKQTLQEFANTMNEAFANMSPEERAMMEKMMKGNMPNTNNDAEPILNQTGSDNVNSYACTKYEIYKGSEKVRDLCVTKWSNIEGGNEIQATLKKMGNFMSEVTKSISSGPSFLSSMIKDEKNIYQQVSKLNGFPINTIDYSNGIVTGVTTFKSSKKISLDAAAFEPPAGYKKQEMGM